jgi:hypothetical protein
LFYTISSRNEQARTVPPRYAFHLEDLRVFHLVRASCHACGHKAIVPNAALLQGRPGYTRLSWSLSGSCGAENAGQGAAPRWRSNFGRAIEI